MGRKKKAKNQITSRDITAYHEAGHIVAAWVLDKVLPQEVILTDQGGITKGVGYATLEDLHRHAHTEVVSYMSGPAAEELATGGKARDWNREEWGDETQAAALIGEAQLGISPEVAKREATRLVRSHWGIVERVARALVAQGRLRHEDLVKIFAERPG